jgi:hypothetical protein
MRRTLLFLLLLAPLAHAQYTSVPRNYMAEDIVNLRLCNHGTVPVEVVVAYETFNANDLKRGFGHTHWNIEGTYFKPHVCWNPYEGRGKQQQVIIGFGFKDAHGQFISGRVTKVPDLGTYEYDPIVVALRHQKETRRDMLMQAAGKSACVHADQTLWGSTDETFPDAGGSCKGFSVSGADDPGTGPFYALNFALDFMPATARDAMWTYYLNFAADAATGVVTVARSNENGEEKPYDRAAEARERQAGIDWLNQQMAQAKKNQDEAERQQYVREHTRNRMRMRDVANFSPQWLESREPLYVRGTVARFEPSPNRDTPARIYFQESPGDAFIACVFPSVRANFASWIGQRVEFRGYVKKACGGQVADISVYQPVGIFELAKGEPSDEAVLPGMTAESGLTAHFMTNEEARQAAMQRQRNVRGAGGQVTTQAAAQPAHTRAPLTDYPAGEPRGLDLRRSPARNADQSTAPRAQQPTPPSSSPPGSDERARSSAQAPATNEQAAASSEKPAASSVTSIPANTPLHIALTDGVDLANTAANDTFQARLESPVRLPNGGVIPQGAAVVLRVSRGTLPASGYVTVNLGVQSVAVDGRVLPVSSTSVMNVLPPGRTAARRVLPPGFRMTFVTTGSPAAANAAR